MLDMRHLQIHMQSCAPADCDVWRTYLPGSEAGQWRFRQRRDGHSLPRGDGACGWEWISLSVQCALLSLVRCLVTKTVDEPVFLYLSWRSASIANTA
jgi:hypothetical protein